jgi:hypothetical protein
MAGLVEMKVKYIGANKRIIGKSIWIVRRH